MVMRKFIAICFSNLKKAVEPEDTKAALVKEQCRLDMGKYLFSQRVINESNKLSNDCVKVKPKSFWELCTYNST